MTPETFPWNAPLCFEAPRRLTESAWHGHIPFAFALVQLLRPRTIVELGAFKGDSYCAFCQAVDVLNLNCQCRAVDTWTGDEHHGFYGGDVLDELKQYHDPLYGRFSKLIPMRFDEALETTPDRSVDLLHIDGLHSREAVTRDFKNWLPKMSPRGIVLLHDTAVRDKGFGVYLLMNELRGRFFTFEFDHSFGLGVIATGTDLPSKIRFLFETVPHETEWIKRFFAHLGFHIVIMNDVHALGRIFKSDLGQVVRSTRTIADSNFSLESMLDGIRRNR